MRPRVPASGTRGPFMVVSLPARTVAPSISPITRRLTMNSRLEGGLMAAAAVAALAGGGAAIAGATGGGGTNTAVAPATGGGDQATAKDDGAGQPITGSALDKAKSVA